MALVIDTSEFIPTQREGARIEIDKILDAFMEPLMRDTIIAEIKALSYAANMPQGFIDGVKFRKTEKNRGVVINTWGTETKPLAQWFNDGTKQHWIEPTVAEALAFPATSGRHAHAIFFQGENKGVDTLFSKGHYVSGVPRTEAMQRGFQAGKKRLAAEAAIIVRNEIG